MLLGTLSASLLGNMLAGKPVIKSGEGTIRPRGSFQCPLILWPILKYQDVIKMNPNVIMFMSHSQKSATFRFDKSAKNIKKMNQKNPPCYAIP